MSEERKGLFFFVKDRPANPEPSKSPFFPYEKSHIIERLGLGITIVNDGQAGAIVAIMNEAGSAVSFISHGLGTAKNDLYDVFGFGEEKKQIVFSILKDSSWAKARPSLESRFGVSQFSKGLSMFVLLDSVGGVSTYKFLTNRRMEPEIGKGDKPMEENPIIKKDDYEVVFSIVNDGYTDLVMDAAKKAGARGGTILTARGTGNKDIEKFFGVVITPEKQIVMILVPKKIKDAVIAAIYKDVSINNKGQGIAFSFPANDVVGISGEESETEPTIPSSGSGSTNGDK